MIILSVAGHCRQLLYVYIDVSLNLSVQCMIIVTNVPDEGPLGPKRCMICDCNYKISNFKLVLQ